jgi:hypothetical protein
MWYLFSKTRLGFRLLRQSRKSAKIELSTGFPQGVDNFDLSTGYPQAKSYPQDIHSFSTDYPQVYPQFHIVRFNFTL